MNFAKLDTNLSYWHKQTKPLFADLLWNVPEQKTGHINVIGGNNQSFSTPIRIAEFLAQTFPVKTLTTILPDSLRGKVPPLPDLELLPSTSSGSFAKSAQLLTFTKNAHSNLLIGDFSKNSATAIAIADLIRPSEEAEATEPEAPSGDKTASSLVTISAQKRTPDFILTRDTVDLVAPESSLWLTRPRTFLVATIAQLQKVFRAAYYPRMILLSQPILPVIETLHKFTLTYPVTILTFHENQVITAYHGKVITTPIIDTSYSPISLWSGQLAAKVTALNLYNPEKPLEATTAAILAD